MIIFPLLSIIIATIIIPLSPGWGCKSCHYHSKSPLLSRHLLNSLLRPSIICLKIIIIIITEIVSMTFGPRSFLVCLSSE